MIGHLWKLQPESTIDPYKISRKICPCRLLEITQNLLSFDRVSIRRLLRTNTGYCMIGRISKRMGYAGNHICRSYLDEKEHESIHIFDFDLSNHILTVKREQIVNFYF